MTPPRHSTVAIIGAGPSGLVLGSELRSRGVNFVILEKGGAGDSWSRMPKHLKLVSPWKTNWLMAESADRFAPNAQLTRAEFLRYLEEFAAEHRLPLVTQCSVLAVERTGGGFVIQTTRGEFTASMVVNATGYFSNPRIPRFAGDDSTQIMRRHYAGVVGADEIVSLIERSSEVLIVGGRLSAGQLALELFDAGLSVSISHRSPIRFGVGDWLWPLVYRNFARLEAVRLRFGSGSGKLDVPMQGGRVRKLIRSGAIRSVPAIECFERERVVLQDGSKLAPKVVVYATGFAPSLQFLNTFQLATHPDTGVPQTRDMESVSVPNLFFLGFESLRNFQSRFLRGLRNDAVVLAGIIEQRLAQAPESKARELCVA